MITVLQAPPFLTIQDRGRENGRIHGVPPSGAMDGEALMQGNLLAGNPADVAGLEWALGPGSLRFEQPTTFAVTGALGEARLGARSIALYSTVRAERGEVLTIGRITTGRFLYLAVHGGIDVPLLLGSRSTYLPGRFGGLEGRRLRAGDSLQLGKLTRAAPREGFTVPPEFRIRYDEVGLRVVEGPQSELFGKDGWREFLEGEFVVSPASDRMGYRLSRSSSSSSPARERGSGGELPSESACPGAIQLPAGGIPIVLLADGPTVGGYPKIAVVVTPDLGLLAQRLPGESVRFRVVSISEAQLAYRHRADQLRAFDRLAARATRGA